MQPLLPQTAGCTYLKMIQWLNVRAVGAIKANPFEGRTPSRLLFLCLFLFLQLPPHRRIPPSSARRPTRLMLQTLSLRFGPHCQLAALLSSLTGSFFLLSSGSRGQRRPYNARFLFIHLCQVLHCQSNQISLGRG